MQLESLPVNLQGDISRPLIFPGDLTQIFLQFPLALLLLLLCWG